MFVSPHSRNSLHLNQNLSRTPLCSKHIKPIFGFLPFSVLSVSYLHSLGNSNGNLKTGLMCFHQESVLHGYELVISH